MKCPKCGNGREFNLAWQITAGTSVGAVSICLYCQEIALFNADQSLKKPTQEEKAEILRDPGIHLAIKELKRINRLRSN